MQPAHVGTVAISIALATRVFALAFGIDPPQWGELDWRVEAVALVAFGSVCHLTHHRVLVATLNALKVADSNSNLLTDWDSFVPLLAATTSRPWVMVWNSHMPAFDFVVFFGWFAIWTLKLSPMPRHY